MMTKWILISAASLLGVGLMATACNAGSTATKSQAKTAKTNYVKTSKPGAAIEFRNVSGGAETDASSRLIRLSVLNGYTSGTLSIEVNAGDNLSLSGGSNSYLFDMSADAHEIALKVKPLSEGKHYVNFVAIAEYGQGQTARTYYSLPVYSGMQAQKIDPKPETAEALKNISPGLILMDAEETIETNTPK